MSSIDITNLVEAMRASFVLAAKAEIMALALAIPGVGPATAWIINHFFSPLLNWVLTKVSQLALMQAFFLNTAVRKAGQAGDYVAALNAKKALPPTVTEDEYEKYELAEISAFNEFVGVTK